MKRKNVKNFDTGNMLRWQMKKSKTTVAQLSKSMNRKLPTVISLLKGKSVQAYILWEFCHALNHNFFADFAGWLPAEMPHNNERIQELEKQLTELKAENESLRKVLELLRPKN